MASLVEAAITNSVNSVVQKDKSLAEEVLAKEADVNRMEVEIDDFAIKLLALMQPMAVDLRLIAAALKINTDLERMGDLAVNIAERAIELIEEPVIKPMVDIPHIAALVQSMVQKALDYSSTKIRNWPRASSPLTMPSTISARRAFTS